MLRALLYIDLAGVPSVHELIRGLERDKYKMKIPGLDSLPGDSVFSRFKRVPGSRMDRVIAILTGILSEEGEERFVKLGVDSTGLEAHSKKDKRAGWGYHHIEKSFYKGYAVYLLYDTRLLVPVSYLVTSASVYDNTRFRRLAGRLGPGIHKTAVLFADRVTIARPTWKISPVPASP